MIANVLATEERPQITVKSKPDNEIKILWVDDEIDFLLPHVLFLEEKGYKVTTVTNGLDAISVFTTVRYDLVFLDENMPGLSGIETLTRLKNINESVPVVMVTKTEAESIMKEAINGRIADYLAKPVNLTQIINSVKRNLDVNRPPADDSAHWIALNDDRKIISSPSGSRVGLVSRSHFLRFLNLDTKSAFRRESSSAVYTLLLNFSSIISLISARL